MRAVASQLLFLGGLPKRAKSRGEVPLLLHQSTEDSTTPQLSASHPTPTMSFTSPLRQLPIRPSGSWTCLACSRSLARVPRARNPAFTAQRWLNTAKSAPQGTVPRMDQMHAQYKMKNRTVM